MIFLNNILLPFVDVIEKYGDNNAFCINEKFYTYSELSQHISKIRNAIQKSEILNNNIGLVANDDIETYASIFAIWLEGLAYVPLHPKQAIERSLEIANNAEIEIIIDSSSKTVFTNQHVIESSKLKFDKFDLETKIQDDDELAYILFTSGSTGKPKGVQITRKNITSFVKSFLSVGFELNNKDRCLQCFDLTFDVSIQSFLVPLLKGACVYTVPHNQIKYSYVYGLLEEHKLTFGAMAPSMIRYLKPYFDEINIPSMRYNILTAEASPFDLLVEWSKCLPNSEIYDFYGPTEGTIYCTFSKLEKDKFNKQLNGLISIGKPMYGMDAIIVDEDNKILSSNEKGELCISGEQITKGYWKSTEKNKQSFFEKEIDGDRKRFYKTGDICLKDEEGDIMYLGRLDHQVKIQGYRVELGEIEFHAREFLKGQNAIAIPFNNQLGNTEIALFIEGAFANETKLVEYFNSKIPFYMVPTKLIIKNKFPINSNGKIDRNKLKELLT